MAHLTACGVTIPGAADTFDETPEFVGDLHQRATSGALGETRTGRKRAWSCTTSFLQAGTAEMLRKLLEGDGHAFSFSSNVYSNKGLGPDVGGSYTQAGSGGPFAGRITVASGNTFPLALQNAMGAPGGWAPSSYGFTILVWRFDVNGDDGSGGAGTWTHYILTGTTTMATGSANPAGVAQLKNGVAGSFNAGRWAYIDATGNVRMQGKGASAGASVAKDYADLVVLPFAIDATTAAGLYSFHGANPWPGPGRRVRLGGDAIPDPLGVDVVCRTSKVAQRNVRLAGAHRNNARVLSIDFTEV